jgi:hypothetical protein
MARDPTPELESAVDRAYPGHKKLRFNDRTWFVSDTGTAKEVSEKINVRKGGISGVVVLPGTGAYYGVASTAVWDWMRAALEETNSD